jgi:hypothetical protein
MAAPETTAQPSKHCITTNYSLTSVFFFKDLSKLTQQNLNAFKSASQ